MKIQYSPSEAKKYLANFSKKDFRENQEAAINFIIQSKKRIRILKAATGTGKSLIAMTSGIIAGGVNYLCSTKVLQEQVVRDFPEARSIWGRGNYICLADARKNCDECTATRMSPCHTANSCLYKIAKQKVLDCRYRILNYAYYLTEIQYAGRFSGFPLTIVDEADSLEGSLVNHICLSFTERALFQLGLESGPSRKNVQSKDGISSWRDFGNVALHRAEDIVKKLNKEIDAIGKVTEDWQFKIIRERDHFKHIAERCEIFLGNVDSTWLMEEIPRVGSRQGMTNFRPLWITPQLAEDFMWKHSQDWVLMSASFPPIEVLCKQLGIDRDEVDYYSMPSTFSPLKRPVNLWPVANMTSKTIEKETPKVLAAIKRILSWHPNERGLIHSVSYSLTKRIMEGIDNPRLVTHENSKDRQDVLDLFIETNDNSVLVSPSMERGVNLNDDKCRFIIVVKAPFLSLGDKVVSARVYSSTIGNLWYLSQMMLTVEQQCGRGMRSENDYCITYLIDQQIERVYNQRPSLWDNWFQDAITWGPNKLLESDPDF